MVDKFWYKVSRTVVKAGNMPFPISDTLVSLLKALITEEQAKFLLIFRKPSLNIDQIKAKTDLDDEALDKMLNDLMDNGIVVGMPSRTTGVMVYRLLGPFPGMFEYTLMRGETGEKQQKIVVLFEELFDELSVVTQENYDMMVSQYKNFPAMTRVVPVEELIEEVPVEKVLPSIEVSKIIDNYDTIALTHCYCRHEKDLLNEPCKVTDERLNCFLLGKGGEFAIKHKFAEPCSKEDAKRIMKESEDAGLVHKAFHVHLNPELNEEAICNCCSCCCGIFQMFKKGITAYHCLTNFVAEIIDDDCVGCGTCEEKCPMEAITIEDAIAVLDKDRCIGCGVCAHHCPEKAIKLIETGQRDVFVPPPRINS